MSRMMDKKSTAAEGNQGSIIESINRQLNLIIFLLDSNGSVAEAVDESGEEDRKAGPGRPRRSCTQRTSSKLVIHLLHNFKMNIFQFR